jgi:hypothetical protein
VTHSEAAMNIPLQAYIVDRALQPPTAVDSLASRHECAEILLGSTWQYDPHMSSVDTNSEEYRLACV